MTPTKPLAKFVVSNDVLLTEVAQLLAEGKHVTLRAKGNSMLPFIRGDRDSVVLHKESPAVGSIVLARTIGGVFVLHRVMAISNGVATLMGDGNAVQTERCVATDIAGVVVQIIKPKGVTTCSSTAFRRRSNVWRLLLPVRRYLLWAYRHLFHI